MCRCNNTPTPGSASQPIEVDASDSEYHAPAVASPALRPVDPPAGCCSPRREIAEDVPISAVGSGTAVSSVVDRAESAEPVRMPPPVSGQRCVRSSGRIKSDFRPAPRYSGRMSSGVANRRPYIARISFTKPKSTPVRGRDSRAANELSFRKQERLRRFLKVRGLNSEGPFYSEDIRWYEAENGSLSNSDAPGTDGDSDGSGGEGILPSGASSEADSESEPGGVVPG